MDPQLMRNIAHKVLRHGEGCGLAAHAAAAVQPVSAARTQPVSVALLPRSDCPVPACSVVSPPLTWSVAALD